VTPDRRGPGEAELGLTDMVDQLENLTARHFKGTVYDIFYLWFSFFMNKPDMDP
jgi:hypothetical protein